MGLGGTLVRGTAYTGAAVGAGYVVDQTYFDGEYTDSITAILPDADPAIIEQLRNLGRDSAQAAADAATVVALETAQIGPEAQFEGFYAFLEQLGTLFNNVLGGEAGLGFINWARDAQSAKDPLVSQDGELVGVSTLEETPDMDVGSAFDNDAFRDAFVVSAAGKDLDDMAQFTTALKEAAVSSGHEEMVDEIDALSANFNSLPGMTAEIAADGMEAVQQTISTGNSLDVAAYAMNAAMN